MKIVKRVICISMAAIIYGCASSPHPVPVYDYSGNSYTSAYPVTDISDKLANVQQSVQRIITTVQYQVFSFGDESVSYNDFLQKALKPFDKTSTATSQSNAGTAVSILKNNNYTVFITAYHVIESPDTVYSFRPGPNEEEQAVLNSVSIKTDNDIFLFDGGSLIALKLLAIDPNDDLALLVADNDAYDFSAPPLSIQTGTASNLNWGSLIYVFGFPLGNPMLTRGIVSSPDYDRQGGFLTDALFNHGISGGLIIASNDGYNTFEWVGMSSTASVRKRFFLVPNPTRNIFYHDYEAYVDTAYINKMNFINYGVSRAIPIEAILKFIYANEEKLNDLGFSAAELPGQ